METSRAVGNFKTQVLLLDNLGTTAGLIGEPSEATGYLAQALDLARRLRNNEAATRILPKLAENAKKAKDLPTTIGAYRELLARAEASGDRSAQALNSGILGKALLDSGQAEAATPVLRGAASLFSTNGSREEAGVAFFLLGRALAKQEQYRGAAEAYEQAAVIERELDDASRGADALQGLGDMRYYLGDYTGAKSTFKEALRLAQRSGERSTEATILMSLGNAQHYSEKPEIAIGSWEQTLKIARDLRDRKLEGEALGNLALAYAHLREFDKAEDYYRQDIAIARERGERLVEAQALGNLATLRMSAGAWADAVPLLQQSSKLAGELGYRRGEAIALENLGRSQLHTAQPAAAATTLRAAVAIFEELREHSKGSDTYNVSLLDAQRGAYRALQAALVANNQPEAALEASERGRARALADLLAARGRPAATVQSPSIEAIRAIAQSRRATLVEYSIIENSDDADDKGAILMWVVRPDKTVMFRRLSMQSHGASLEESLEGIVRDTRATLGALGRHEVPAAKPGIAGRDEMLSLFYKLVMAPVADLLPEDADEPVVIIPQGALFLLPFAALCDPDGHTLVQSHSLLFAASIQTLAFMKDHPADTTGKTALVVGNPVFSAIQLDPDSDPVTLPPLPGAESESTAVARLLGATPLIGQAATKKAVLRDIAAARYIHLATHGILEYVRDKGVPGALALTPSDGDDGLLTTQEIMSLRLNANLVVLSACNTGGGRISRDGVIGLSRAFIVAGAHSAVVSLWNAPDQPTRELMVTFYQALQNGSGKAQALRHAMLETSQQHSDPLDWAGFMLLGENE